MTPESVGLSGSTLTLGKLSGRAGFDERLSKLGIHVEPDELDRLYGEAITLADRKKQVTDADLLALVEQHADPVPVLVELEHWATASRQGESSSGNVSIFYGGQTFRAFSGGNGPVDALLSAVDNALEQIIGGRPLLVDYSLRSIGAGEDAQGEATVKIAAPAGDDRRPPNLHRTRLIDQRRRGEPPRVPRRREQAHRRACRRGEPGNHGWQRRMTTYRVAYLPGDGIGPEVCAVARRCVEAAGERFGFSVALGRAARRRSGNGCPRPTAARGDARRPAARPMRCCSGPSAVRPGMIRRPPRDRRTHCSASALHSNCSRTCGPCARTSRSRRPHPCDRRSVGMPTS